MSHQQLENNPWAINIVDHPSEEIVDADGVERFTDSSFNSCVPLSRGDHQGVLPKAAGEHHYPIPIKGGTSSATTTSSSGSRSRTARTRRSHRSLGEARVTVASSFRTPGTARKPATRSTRRSRRSGR